MAATTSRAAGVETFARVYARALREFRLTGALPRGRFPETVAEGAAQSLVALPAAQFARVVRSLTPGQQAVIDTPTDWSVGFAEDAKRGPALPALDVLDDDFVLGAPTMGGYNEESGGGIFRWTERALQRRANASVPRMPAFTSGHQATLRHCISTCEARADGDVVQGAAMQLGLRVRVDRAGDAWEASEAYGATARRRATLRVRVSTDDGGRQGREGQGVDGRTVCEMVLWRDDDFARHVVTSHAGTRMGIPSRGGGGEETCKRCLVLEQRGDSSHSTRSEPRPHTHDAHAHARDRAVLLMHCWAFAEAAREGLQCVCVRVNPRKDTAGDIYTLAFLAKYQRGFGYDACPRSALPLFQPRRVFWAPPRMSDAWMLRPTPTGEQFREILSACVCTEPDLTETLYAQRTVP